MAGRRIVITIKVEGASKAVRDLSSVNKKGKETSAIWKRISQNFGAAVIAARALSGAYTNVKRALDFGVKSAISFEFSMKKVQAITGTTGDELASLEGVVRDLASVSPRTATEVANTALAMAKLGLSSKEVEDALEGVIGLSVALDENVESVGSTLVAVKNVFQKEASELTQISDQLFTGFANSALNLDKFSTAFSFAGGAAKLAGVEFDELTSLMGILSNAGIRSSTIGTQLRSIFLEMSNESSKFGRATGGLTIKQDGLVKVLGALKEVAGSSAQAYRLFGKRAVSIVGVLRDSVDKFEALRGTISDSEGATKKAADTLSDSMAVALKEVSSEWVDLNIAMSKFYGPILIGVLGAIKEILRSLKEMPNVMQEVADSSSASFFRSFANAIMGMSSSEVIAARKEGDKHAKMLWDNIDAMKALEKENVRSKEQGALTAFNTLTGVKPAVVAGGFNVTGEAEKALSEEMQNEARAAEEADVAIDNLNFRFKQMNDAMALAKVGLGELGMTRAAFAAEMRGLAESFLDKGKVEEALEAATIATKLEQEAISAAKKNRDQELKDLKALDKATDEHFAKKAEAEERAAEAADAKFQAQEEYNQKLIETSFAFQEVTTAVEALGSALNTVAGTAVDQLFRDTVDWGETFKAILKDVIKQLIATAIRVFIVDSLLKGVTGAFGAGGIFAGSSFIGPPKPPGLASGFDGVINKPTPLLVGEAGPERVQVTPSAKTARGGTSGGLTVNINGDVYGEEKFTQAVNMAMQNIDRDYVGV